VSPQRREPRHLDSQLSPRGSLFRSLALARRHLETQGALAGQQNVVSGNHLHVVPACGELPLGREGELVGRGVIGEPRLGYSFAVRAERYVGLGEVGLLVLHDRADGGGSCRGWWSPGRAGGS
jgi:hypothetical protein